MVNALELRLARQRFKSSYERLSSLSYRCSITMFPQTSKRKKLFSCGIWQRASATVLKRIPTANLTWLKSLVENYGIDTFKRFAIFCDDWHIWDLHNDNIGFLRTPEVELPIILDWMSD